MRSRTKGGLFQLGLGVLLLRGWIFVPVPVESVPYLAAAGFVAFVGGVLRLAVGGYGVLFAWLVRYRRTVPIRVLGDIIGEYRDDMVDVGLAVERKSRRAQPKPTLAADGTVTMASQGPPQYTLPRYRHDPDPVGIRITMHPVRGAQTQEDLIAAVPRLRSAWGVDRIDATPVGAREVQFVLHVLDAFEGTRAADLPPVDDEGEPWLTA